MAPKPRGSAPAPVHPADSEESGKEEATSEEEEVNGGSGSESDSESEQPDKSHPTKKPAPAPPVKKPAQAPPVKKPETSSDEEESGSDSGSDSPVKKPIANIKPIASKPTLVMTPNSKANSSIQSLPTKSISAAGAKRPANSENGGGDGEGKDTKRLKKKPQKYVEELEKKGNSENGGGDGEGKDTKRLKKKPEKYVEESEKKGNSETGGGGDGEGKETKRLKKKPEKYVEVSEKKGNSTDDSRKLFQRLWSEDDEIAILKGMLDYSAKKNADPVANLDDFHEFIKKSLHIDVTRSQLQDKIRRLRRKYSNNADKEKNGKERIFAKDHEQKTFEWSKKVWGKENSTVEKKLESPYELKSTNAKTRKPKIEVKEVEVEGRSKEGKISINEDTRLEEEGLKLGNIGLRNSGIEEWIKENIVFLDEEKRAEMEKKGKYFKLVEGEFYAKKLELMLEETNLIVDALKSSAT